MTPSIIPTIERPDPAAPILVAADRASIHIRAGTTIFARNKAHVFAGDMPLTLTDLVPGRDYAVTLAEDGTPLVFAAHAQNPLNLGAVAGFHFAPGGNAPGRAGGDAVPAINPFSIWDAGFRPSADDPRGATLIEGAHGRRFWLDIYMLGVDHKKNGTSRFGVKIADGRSLPKLDHSDAVNALAGHGKRLPTYEEFKVAAFGVTEKSSADRDPDITGLDAARTSRYGLMQATGNLWIWGTDGDPDDPRPALFGGSWVGGGVAGSRYAALGLWDGLSSGGVGCRGASDHLQPA